MDHRAIREAVEAYQHMVNNGHTSGYAFDVAFTDLDPVGCIGSLLADLDAKTAEVEALRGELMTDRMFDLICAAIDKADTITMDADYMLDSDDCIRVVRTMQALIDVCGITQKEQGK